MNDPLLHRNETIQQLEKQLEELKRSQQLRVQVDVPYPTGQNQRTVWDDISDELNGMTESQKGILFSDPEYQQADQMVAAIAAKYQMSLLMPYVAGDEEGKKALERQLLVIKTKKDDIVKRENEELEEFRRWKQQQARQATSKK